MDDGWISWWLPVGASCVAFLCAWIDDGCDAVDGWVVEVLRDGWVHA